MKVSCSNCKLSFEADEDSNVRQCPRCSSKNLKFVRAEKEFEKREPQRRFYTSQGIVYGETKDAWKSFHQQDAKACAKCGGIDFDLNFKRREKTCKKCGEIYPLPRR